MKRHFYTAGIILAAGIAYCFPACFVEINGFALKQLIKPLLMVIMFGMGMTMTKSDFAAVARSPKAVGVGLLCQFTIMPLLGFALARGFAFEPEIAAGVVLVGCSPSGLASNVMAYIAKANVALSITITSCATLLAPLLTPLLMRLLGGQFIAIDFWAMMLEIVQIIILPVAIGATLNTLFGAFTARLQPVFPVLSMFGIAAIIVVVTAAGQKSLQATGLTLLLAVLLHNTLGYLLGYWGARRFGLPEQDCRTVAIEVGLQNAGLASGLANQMGKLATVGVAPALFGPLMNISGSLLASWWSRR